MSYASTGSPHASTSTPLSLEQVVSIALRHNPNLSAQENALSSSKLSLESARSDFKIQIVPTGNAGISGGFDQEDQSAYSAGATVSKTFPIGSQVVISPTIGKRDDGDESNYQNSVGLELNQPLFQGVSPEFNLSAIHGAEFGVRSARRRYFLAQVDVFVQSVSGFYDILLQKQLVENNRQSVGRLEAFTQAAKIKRKIGLAEPEDEYRATQRLKQAKDDLVASQQALKLSEDNLKRLLDWSITNPIYVNGDLTLEPVAVDETDAVATALENRVEIDEAKDQLKQNYRLSRDAKHRLLPDLDISLIYTALGQDPSFDRAVALNDNRWGLSLSTSTDLFRRTEKAGYEQSLLTIEDAKRNLSTLRDDIVRQVRETIRNLNESDSSIELQKARAREAQIQLELSRFKFKYGMTNNFDLIDAESVLSAAQSNVENAKVQYIVGVYRLRAAMGSLIQKPKQDP